MATKKAKADKYSARLRSTKRREVVRWFTVVVLPLLKGEGDNRTAREALLWWGAYRYAESFLEDTTRHIAQAIQAGIPRFNRWEDLEATFEEFDDFEEDGLTPAQELERALRDFFVSDQ